mmetsp:Transcript_5912/g.14589  ORF Transcript_5912/g.14589 Transcript_5912/m.14589 type:complete len:250 (+) Transcript_5912:682-1431(+)
MAQHQLGQVGGAAVEVAQHAVADDRMADDLAPLLGLQWRAALQMAGVEIELAHVVEQAGQADASMLVHVAGQQPARQRLGHEGHADRMVQPVSLALRIQAQQRLHAGAQPQPRQGPRQRQAAIFRAEGTQQRLLVQPALGRLADLLRRDAAADADALFQRARQLVRQQPLAGGGVDACAACQQLDAAARDDVLRRLDLMAGGGGNQVVEVMGIDLGLDGGGFGHVVGSSSGWGLSMAGQSRAYGDGGNA